MFNNLDNVEKLLFGLLVFLGILLIYVFIWAIISFNVDAQCLEYGWKDSSVTYNFHSYCIREENEYEITKSLEQVRGEYYANRQ